MESAGHFVLRFLFVQIKKSSMIQECLHSIWDVGQYFCLKVFANVQGSD